MKVKLILPIATLHGKLNGKANFYFKTVNGKTYVQRCPNRSSVPPTAAQTAARQRFTELIAIVNRLHEQQPKLSKKQLWKIAKEQYESAH